MCPTAPREKNAHGDPGVRVSVASDQHASGIARIYNHYVDAGGATFDATHWTTEQVIKLIHGERPEGWLVAIKDNIVVGWASARLYSLRYGYRFTCETAIYLDPTALGSGVGDLLQKRLNAHCREAGIHHAVARIIADNERSLAFHRRFGYELVGIQKEIGHTGGSWTDVAILQKIFEEGRE